MSIADTPAPRSRWLLLVHGRDFKPAADKYLALCREAVRVGLERDRPDLLPALDNLATGLGYFGDLSAALLKSKGKIYDEALDVVDRENALQSLQALGKAKKFGLGRYDRLPGKTAFKEFLADVGAPLIRPLGLSGAVIGRVCPELGAYWDQNSPFRTDALARITEPLRAAMRRGDDIAIVSHGIGAVITYDALWELSRGEHAESSNGGKVSLWVTTGAPLGDPAVKARLRGAGSRGAQCYPGNVLVWHNIAAEDDYTCHDKTVRDDYSAMLSHKLISRIQDCHIYNLAVRYGRSNPHSSVGYLVHPKTIGILAEWLDHTDKTY